MKVTFQTFKSAIEKNKNVVAFVLIFGTNQVEIQQKLKQAINILCGPIGIDDLRINKLTENSVIKDPQTFYDKIQTFGFFPGKQIVIIDNATERIREHIERALKSWSKDDATIIAVAASLKINSTLRRLAEGHESAICLAVYDEQKDTDKIRQMVDSASLQIIDDDIAKFLKNPNNFSSIHSLASLIEKLEILKFSDANPVSFEEIELLLTEAPSPTAYELINLLCLGKIEKALLSFKILMNTGFSPNQIIHLLNNHFTTLHKLSLNIKHPDIVLRKTFPPLFGRRKDQIIKHSRIWSTKRIEHALGIIYIVEKQIRLSQKLDASTLLERVFLRISQLFNAGN